MIISSASTVRQSSTFADCGVGQYISHLMTGTTLSPLLMCWTVAALLRIAVQVD
ncbi:GntT/GntP/DsdX family permease [Escherichia coli]|uniref:GntT/GntP/DsdX family permease n=1 Tax=Escherichia coli TaxID=562 RepID=UPI003531CF07